MEQTRKADERQFGVPDGRPSRDNPAIVLSHEGHWLVCWVEAIENENRWVAAASDGVKYVGPAYGGEASLVRVGDAIRRWWGTQDRSRPSSNRHLTRQT